MDGSLFYLKKYDMAKPQKVEKATEHRLAIIEAHSEVLGWPITSKKSLLIMPINIQLL